MCVQMTRGGLVMAILVVNLIWNQLKLQQVSTPLRDNKSISLRNKIQLKMERHTFNPDFLRIEDTPKTGSYLFLPAYIKDMEEGSSLQRASPYSCQQVYSLMNIRAYFFFFIKYFLHLRFTCFPKSPLYPPPALLPNSSTSAC